MAFGVNDSVDLFSFDPTLTGALKSGVTGSAPSAAEVMRRRMFDEAMKRSMGLIRSQRGMGAAAGARLGAQTQSQLSTEGAQQATALRAQEQQQAVAQMLAQQQSAQQGFYQQQQMEQQRKMFNAQQDQNMFGSIMNAVGGAGQAAMGMFSDKRIKEDIKDASDDEMTEFMSALKAKTFKYKKDSPAPQSKNGEVGIMAQDIEKTKLGKKLVEDVKQYKMEKDGKVTEKGSVKAIRKEALGAALAAVGNLHARLSAVEAGAGAVDKTAKTAEYYNRPSVKRDPPKVDNRSVAAEKAMSSGVRTAANRGNLRADLKSSIESAAQADRDIEWEKKQRWRKMFERGQHSVSTRARPDRQDVYQKPTSSRDK